MIMQMSKAPNRQRGMALVELAIAVPAMLVMMLVTTEITRVMYQHNTLNKLVRDGSRNISAYVLKGSVLTGLTADEIQTAKNLIVSGKPQGGAALLEGFSDDNVSISMTTVGTGGAQRYYVEVSASYNYLPLFATIGGMGFLPQSAQFDFTLSAQSTMRAL